MTDVVSAVAAANPVLAKALKDEIYGLREAIKYRGFSKVLVRSTDDAAAASSPAVTEPDVVFSLIKEHVLICESKRNSVLLFLSLTFYDIEAIIHEHSYKRFMTLHDELAVVLSSSHLRVGSGTQIKVRWLIMILAQGVQDLKKTWRPDITERAHRIKNQCSDVESYVNSSVLLEELTPTLRNY
jgi:hypothetical protein